jgi:DNA-binding response OmpR family regulator
MGGSVSLNKRILVVDDEEMIRGLLEKVFKMNGYEVLTADSAESALDLLKVKAVNVMIFDLKLPGKSGLELCEIVKKQNPVSIIFAMTGYTSIFELTSCREYGFDDYFKKPIDMKMLIASIQNAFARIERWIGSR